MSYWDTHGAATAALERREFESAERLFTTALQQRARSPGRVFWSEKVGDGLRRLWDGLRGGHPSRQPLAGRWPMAASLFRIRFARLAEEAVRAALRLSEFLPDEEAEANQQQLVAALYLLTSSQIFPAEPVAAIPLLKACFRLVARTGRPLPVSLVRADLPLTEEDRLWLARRGDSLLENLFAEDAPSSAAVSRREWALVLLRLLDPDYFDRGSRRQAERYWLEANLCDRHLGEPATSVERYRAYLQFYGEPSASADLARARLLELLANVNEQSFPVPRYAEARAEAERAQSPTAGGAARRFAAAKRVIQWRRPRQDRGLAWGTIAAARDGRIVCVAWWGEQPLDVAFWRPGEDPQAICEFMAPAAGRLLWASEQVGMTLRAEWQQPVSGWPVWPFAEALLEPQLPLDGLTAEAVQRLAMSQAVGWRQGWDRLRGHPLLKPRRAGKGQRPLEMAGVEGAVATGLLWLACQARLRGGDPSLLGGLLEMARCGDAATGFLVEFLDSESGRASGAGTDRWQIPALGMRPDPLTATASLTELAGPESDGPRPDLSGSPVAVVATGRPASVIAAWSGTCPRQRVVLDRLDHRPALGAIAVSGGGLVTLLPRSGKIHPRDEALKLLEELLIEKHGPADCGAAVLPLFHWTRLVESHNGDLLDFLAVRSRPEGTVPLYDRYAELVEELTAIPAANVAVDADPWLEQFQERARSSRLVVGLACQLSGQAATLDALWGVDDGGQAAWIFLDSAAVHWQLWRANGDKLSGLHGLLASRGRRHLSLLLGGSFLRELLEGLLAGWLAPYGSPYCLALADTQPAALHLAVAGITPDAQRLVLPAALAQLSHLKRLAADQIPLVLLPEAGRLAGLWSDLNTGLLPWAEQRAVPQFVPAEEFWSGQPGQVERTGRRIVVPALASLESGAVLPGGADPVAWREADARRRSALARERGLCCLEINALLASGVAAVDVADPRWWRRFPLVADSGETPGVDANQARELAVASAARPYDLPVPTDWRQDRSAGDRVEKGDQEQRAAVRTWLRKRGWIGADGYGDLPGLSLDRQEMGPQTDPGPGVRLHVGGVARAWCQVAVRLAEQQELGARDHWLLVVGETSPPGAEQLVAAYPGVGGSVWPPAPPVAGAGANGEVMRGDCPLLWVEPATICEPEFLEFLARRPPQAVFAGDLQRWLPSAASPRLTAAAVLRWLMSSDIPRVDLFTSTLSTAWLTFFEALWAAELPKRGRIVPPVVSAGAADSSGAALQIPLARLPELEVLCPGCGTYVAYRSEPAICESCGLDCAVWLDEAGHRELAHARLRAKLVCLLDRQDLGSDEPLHIWLRQQDLGSVELLLRELRVPAFHTGDHLRAEPADGRTWLLAPAMDLPNTPLAGSHALLFTPAAELLPLLPADQATATLSIWLSGDELAGEMAPSPAERAMRCRRLLTGLSRWCARGNDTDDTAGGVLIPGSYLATLCGLPREDLLADLNLLRWQTVLAGELAPSPQGTTATARSLELLWPAAEVEPRLRRLAGALEVLVPLLLARTRAGLPTECDLNALPARLPPEYLAWLDRFLLASSLRLSARLAPSTANLAGSDSAPVAPEQAAAAVDGVELLYEPVAGLLFSGRRRVGYLGSIGDVTARLLHRLDLFLAAIQLILADLEITPSGVTVVPSGGLATVLDSDALELGSLLGLWRWRGAAGENELPLDGLRSLAGSESLRSGRATSHLRALAVEQERWITHLRRSLSLGLLEPPVSEPRTVAEPGSRLPDRDVEAAQRVTDLVLAGDSALLALRGPAGSGRLPALLAGLAAAVRDGFSIHGLTMYCPDAATAARAHLAWRRELRDLQPPLVVADEAGLPTTSGTTGPSAVAATGLVGVLLEAQRLPPEQRFRISQHCRPGILILTVDTAEAEEPWEHLFLTTPCPEEVIDLPDQRRQTRQIWREVRELITTERKHRGKGRRRDKGSCLSQWAANLDECVAILEEERQAGRLSGEVALCAPLPDDLVYLGRRLAKRGWLPVYRQELDELLLPGPCEFLAAVTGSAGALRAAAADAGSAVEAESGGGSPGTELLISLLPGGVHDQYRQWWGKERADATTCLQDFYEEICRARWAGPFLATGEARQRVERLVADFGTESLARFCERPLWEAWRRELAGLFALPTVAEPQPLVTLATGDIAGGRLAAAGVYLCLGTEPARYHYRVLSRITDQLLVLYQENSPLPSEATTDVV